MDLAAHPSNVSGIANSMERLSHLAPAPTSVKDTGLSENFLAELLSKHLYEAGVLTIGELSLRVALPGKIVEDVLHFLRQEARVEVLAGIDATGSLRFSLTDRGRHTALDAIHRNGYVGPAPVPLHEYAKVVRSQTVHNANVTKGQIDKAFDDIVIKDQLIDQLGPSLNSGRAIFIYGPAGTGKTFITQRLARLFIDEVLVPHAIAINDSTIAIFDPVVHQKIEHGISDEDNLYFKNNFDQRWVCCERPVLISGGELSSEMLDVQMEQATKEYQAPLQLKANNGIFIIDDMGRQRVAPETVFNRWIVPMEEQKDYLSLGSGRHFSVPFDLVLVFSTNMNPHDLADEAFLRRIGYKIEFGYLDRDEYETIWNDTCRAKGVVCSQSVLDFVIEELHQGTQTPLLPCHPRDLIGIAVDYATYMQEPRTLTNEHMAWAWKNYFVSLNSDSTPQLKTLSEIAHV